MICLGRPTFTYSGYTYQLNEAYRELGKSIITIIDFGVYKPTKQIRPLVKDQSGRIYFSHWDNLKTIPFGQIELFGCSNADPDEPPEPIELDDTPKFAKSAGQKLLSRELCTRLIASDIPHGSEWRCKSGLHPC